MFYQKILTIKEKLYLLIRSVKQSTVGEHLEYWKYFTHCDRVFFKDGNYHFVHDIDEVEPIVEEIIEIKEEN